MTQTGQKRWIYLLIGVLVVISFSLWLLTHKPGIVSEPLPEVRVVMIDTARVEVYGEYDGRIRASQSVEVTARVEGILEKMLFKEGSYVTKGQPLFIIDPKLYQAQVDRAKAELDRARALLNKANRDLARIRPLYTQKAASQLDLDNAEAAVECAEADVEISKVGLLEANVTLGYTRVAAPISGYISESAVDVGALVGPGGRALLATIVRSDTLMVDFSMTSSEYLKSKDKNVSITLADGSEYLYKGLVDFVDPVVDTKTGTFTVRAELPNPEGSLLPGEKTKVKVLLGIVEGGMTVPAVAVQDSDEGKFVYVISADGIVEKRPVSLGMSVGKRIIVKSGLAPGEMVATDKFDILYADEKVVPVNVQINKNSKKLASPSEGRK